MEKRLFLSIFFGFLAVIFHRAKCFAEEYLMHEDGVDMLYFMSTGIPSSFCVVDCAIWLAMSVIRLAILNTTFCAFFKSIIV